MIALLRVDASTPPDVARARQRAAVPLERVEEHDAAPDARALVRLLPGAYVAAADWGRLDDRSRHLTRIAALAPAIEPQRVVSHWSAAAMHGWPRLGRWPAQVDLSEPGRTSTERRRRAFVLRPSTADLLPPRRGAGPAASVPMTVLGQTVRVSSPVVTAADTARTAGFRDAVVALDAALRAGVEPDALRALVERAGRRNGRRARRAVDFADARSESVGESLLRVLLHELGAPTPVLQHAFRSPSGAHARVDFWFPDQGVVVEFDGEAKYRDPALRGGRSAEQVVIDEKYREDWIRALPDVRGVVRIRWSELFQRARLAVRLRGAGIPLAPAAAGTDRGR